MGEKEILIQQVDYIIDRLQAPYLCGMSVGSCTLAKSDIKSVYETLHAVRNFISATPNYCNVRRADNG